MLFASRSYRPELVWEFWCQSVFGSSAVLALNVRQLHPWWFEAIRQQLGRVVGVVAWVGEVDALTPAPIGVQTMRTEFGRPNSSMRLRT